MLKKIRLHLTSYSVGYLVFFSQSIVFVSSLLSSSSLIIYDFSIFNALLYHLLFTILFIIGYLSFKKKIHKKSNESLIISPLFYILGFFLSLIGILVTFWQVSITVEPINYLADIFSGNFNINIREAFLLSSENGGLSGFIKMFHITPLGVFLMCSSHLSFSTLQKYQKKKLSRFVALNVFLVLLKILFSLDRLSILGLLIGFAILFRNKIFSPAAISIFVFLFFLGNNISSLRLNGFTLLDFIILYSKSALVNFELMIRTNSTLTYGFSTFLHPISYFFQGLRISVLVPSSTYDWIWNPAQYFYSNLYQDFGMGSFLVIFTLGYISRFIEKKSNFHYSFYRSYYLILLFVLGTFITVPLIRAPEFWFLVIIIFYLSNFIKNSKPRLTYFPFS